jgi:hypothetical protein
MGTTMMLIVQIPCPGILTRLNPDGMIIKTLGMDSKASFALAAYEKLSHNFFFAFFDQRF